LFDAAYFGQEDPILGVSECIISGVPMRIGTGFFDLMYSGHEKKKSDYEPKATLFDDDSLHMSFSYEIDRTHAPQ
jgi:DNA-directed RNA polymerase III subunit RPC1